MNKLDELIDLCKDRNINCSVTYQKINDYSVEIYVGYQSNYKLMHYSDGHLYSDDAINSGIAFLIAETVTATERKVAHEMVDKMQDFGLTPDEMLDVIAKAREIYKEKNEKT
jgi:hypothetical protein